jgi:hypothetical protein
MILACQSVGSGCLSVCVSFRSVSANRDNCFVQPSRSAERSFPAFCTEQDPPNNISDSYSRPCTIHARLQVCSRTVPPMISQPKHVYPGPSGLLIWSQKQSVGPKTQISMSRLRETRNDIPSHHNHNSRLCLPRLPQHPFLLLNLFQHKSIREC